MPRLAATIVVVATTSPPKYWLISDRDDGGIGIGRNKEGLSYFISDSPSSVITDWEQVDAVTFQKLLVAAADKFPLLPPEDNEEQKHVSLLLHGYNNNFAGAIAFYRDFCAKLYDGPDSLGLCILYDWPSVGSLLGYYPDRQHARECADDLAGVLSTLYDWLLKKQEDAIVATRAELEGRATKARPCKAKVSVIAHSMGNYLLQKAMHVAWTRKNQPLLSSLVNQLVMVAADVDNDLFIPGAPDSDDGRAMANLTYRITALYSGRDAALGSSAGMKHFGTRRLGRSGLSKPPSSPDAPAAVDNVWDVDCSPFFSDFDDFSVPGLGSVGIHGAYFTDADTLSLMRDILLGIDRGVLESLGLTTSQKWPLLKTTEIPVLTDDH